MDGVFDVIRTHERLAVCLRLRGVLAEAGREAAAAGRKFQIRHRWVPYNQISANLRRAVIVTEDAAFWDHGGVDFQQLKESMEVNLERMRAHQVLLASQALKLARTVRE